MSDYTADGRPRPLQELAGAVTKVTGILTALVTSLAGYGIVTAVQSDAVEGLLGAIPGLVALVGNALAAFQVANRGEAKVTPLTDPRNNAGQQLVPAGIESRGL